jgi:hypothetical protein
MVDPHRHDGRMVDGHGEMSEPEMESDPATGSKSCDEDKEQSVASQAGFMYEDGERSCSQDSRYFWRADPPQQWSEWSGQPHHMPACTLASRTSPFPGLVLAQPGNGYVMVDPHRHDGRMVDGHGEVSEPEMESDPAAGTTSCDEDKEQPVTSQAASMYEDGEHSCSQDSRHFLPADPLQQWSEWSGQPHHMPACTLASGAIPFPGLVLAPSGNSYVMVDPHRHDGRMVMIGALAYPAPGYVMPSSTRTQNMPAEWANVCTVMMRNLPNRITEAQLISEIHGAGFRDTYDFMYMPLDSDTKVNRGYVFLNFTSPENAWKFRLHFEGRQISRFNSSKIVAVVPAALQGYNANQTNQVNFQTEEQAKFQRVRMRNETQSLIDLAKSQLEQRQDAASSSGSGKQKSRQPRHENRTEAHPPATHSSAPMWCQFCGGARMPNFRFCKFCGEAF